MAQIGLNITFEGGSTIIKKRNPTSTTLSASLLMNWIYPLIIVIHDPSVKRPSVASIQNLFTLLGSRIGIPSSNELNCVQLRCVGEGGQGG
jgi:hypothetical protein